MTGCKSRLFVRSAAVLTAVGGSRCRKHLNAGEKKSHTILLTADFYVVAYVSGMRGDHGGCMLTRLFIKHLKHVEWYKTQLALRVIRILFLFYTKNKSKLFKCLNICNLVAAGN